MQTQIGNNVGNKPISAIVRSGMIHVGATWETEVDGTKTKQNAHLLEGTPGHHPLGCSDSLGVRGLSPTGSTDTLKML